MTLELKERHSLLDREVVVLLSSPKADNIFLSNTFPRELVAFSLDEAIDKIYSLTTITRKSIKAKVKRLYSQKGKALT